MGARVEASTLRYQKTRPLQTIDTPEAQTTHKENPIHDFSKASVKPIQAHNGAKGSFFGTSPGTINPWHTICSILHRTPKLRNRNSKQHEGSSFGLGSARIAHIRCALLAIASPLPEPNPRKSTAPARTFLNPVRGPSTATGERQGKRIAMCGIIGHVGTTCSTPILLDGLRRLEYRGYDSAGIVVISESGAPLLRRCEGKLRGLENSLFENPMTGTIGIGHTRWATHGKPTERNAHPHRGENGRVYVVHNGIVENFAELRERLLAEGCQLTSDTDTELIAHLIEKRLDDGVKLAEAVRQVCRVIRGSFGIAVLSATHPDRLIVARLRSPLVVGLGENENFVASDVPALLPYTRRVIYLQDEQLAVVTRTAVAIQTFDGKAVAPEVSEIKWDRHAAEKEGFRHYMLKEIYEQPRVLRELLAIHTDRGERLPRLDMVGESVDGLAHCNRILAFGCGTAWHSCLMARTFIEELARIPTEVDYASELRGRRPFAGPGVLGLAISQSGETADTLAAAMIMRKQGSRLLGICNVEGSSLVREADSVVHTHSGPEIGVASTKAFTGQLMVSFLLAVELGLRRGVLDKDRAASLVRACERLPEQIENLLLDSEKIQQIAWELHQKTDWLYLGRRWLYPIALEGALKLKEISYAHAEGYPAGEMKHGPIALLEPGLPVVALVGTGPSADKMRANIQEAKARDALIIGLSSEPHLLDGLAHHVLELPASRVETEPILHAVALQLLAYYVADARGCDVDQPRNLAKSVTVE